jgi:hypothetical protein
MATPENSDQTGELVRVDPPPTCSPSSLTPETDAAEFPVMTWPSRDHPMVVRSTLARKLETENRLMRKRIAQLLKHRGHVAAETVMDKMASEFPPENTKDHQREASGESDCF